MEVVPFNFTDNRGNEGVVGIRLDGESGFPRVDLFAVEENKGGPSVAKNLFNIAEQVTREMFDDRKVSHCLWTLSVGDTRTWVDFSTVLDELYRIDFSNQHAIRYERSDIPGHAKPLQSYNEAPTFERTRDVIDEDWDIPAYVYAIPCDAADGGFFYMKGEYDVPHLRDKYETVLVDKDALLARLSHDEPAMIEHGDRKHGNGDSQRWADASSMDHPFGGGHFSYACGHFTLCAGNAEILTVMKNLDLPYVPITVSREEAARVKQDIGVGYAGISGADPSEGPIYDH